MNTSILLKSLPVVAGLILTTGCASSRKVAVKTDAPPRPIAYQQSIRITDEQAGDLRSTAIPSEDDPEQIVRFAMSLSNAGRHLHAAQFLDEASVKFASRNNEFAIACLQGAANEFLEAGAMAEFRNAVRRLAKASNRYQLAAFSDEVQALLALGAIANGETTPSELVPRPLRELFPGTTKKTQ